MSQDYSGTVYLQIAAPNRYPQELRVLGATQRRPRTQIPGTVLVKLQLVIPRGAFAPLEPEATVVIPETLIADHVEVEATDAHDH